MSLRDEALKLHEDNKGKISIVSKVAVNNAKDLSLAYTPGVAEPCLEIKNNPDLVYKYTNKANFVAVVTDGSAVLGLGNIGSRAGMPVMEGKAVLFKTFGDVDAFPICLESQDVEDIIFAVKQIAPTFGGINLEDISAPRCFEIEERLKKELDIPVFHDDQHGTAIIVLAAIINGLKVVEKNIGDIKVAVSGAGAAGIAITKLLINSGVKDIIICNSKGILNPEDGSLDINRKEMALLSNKEKVTGNLTEALRNADVFIGVSAAGTLTQDMIKVMNKDAIILAMANPNPEIYPSEAKEAGARIIGTGRSDFPNQVNNVLAFPGIFRGALDVRASEINEEMKLAAAYAIAELISDDELNEEYILPAAFDKRVGPAVAKSVAQAAIDSGVARI